MRNAALAAGVFIAAGIVIGCSKPAYADTKTNHKNNKVVVVHPGDTLEKIAKKYHTTYVRLFNANKQIDNPDLIYPGDKVNIPKSSEKIANRPLHSGAQVSNLSYSTAQYRSYSSRVITASAAVNGGVWDRLAACESGGNWGINTGNGYSGGLQFTDATWRAMGGNGSAGQASKAEQIVRAKALQSRSGWGQWPACSSKLGLR